MVSYSISSFHCCTPALITPTIMSLESCGVIGEEQRSSFTKREALGDLVNKTHLTSTSTKEVHGTRRIVTFELTSNTTHWGAVANSLQTGEFKSFDAAMSECWYDDDDYAEFKQQQNRDKKIAMIQCQDESCHEADIQFRRRLEQNLLFVQKDVDDDKDLTEELFLLPTISQRERSPSLELVGLECCLSKSLLLDNLSRQLRIVENVLSEQYALGTGTTTASPQLAQRIAERSQSVSRVSQLMAYQRATV